MRTLATLALLVGLTTSACAPVYGGYYRPAYGYGYYRPGPAVVVAAPRPWGWHGWRRHW